jgi:flagellar basal-body rod modification protein FlgD
MNALVSARANSAGTLSVRRQERVEARKDILSNFRARLEGIQRAMQQQELLKAGAAALTAGPPQAEKAGDTGSATKAYTGVNYNYDRKPPQNELGRDAYLQLLVQQLSNQDPTEPMDNQQMIAQLAQFSSLEQMQNLNTSFMEFASGFEIMNGNIDQLNFISAQGLLGKFVEGVDADGKLRSGTVESVHLSGSLVVLTVDGKPMPMSGVIGIATRPAESPQPETQEDGEKHGLLNGLFKKNSAPNAEKEGLLKGLFRRGD